MLLLVVKGLYRRQPTSEGSFRVSCLRIWKTRNRKRENKKVLKYWTCIPISLRYHFRSSSETKRNWHVRNRRHSGRLLTFLFTCSVSPLRCEQLTGTSVALQLSRSLGNTIAKNIFLLKHKIVSQILLCCYRCLRYDNGRISVELGPMVERLVSVIGCGYPTLTWCRDWKFLLYGGTIFTLLTITAFLLDTKHSG